MKKIIFMFILIFIFAVSCLEDLDAIKKKSLFAFYEDMKTELLNDNIKWIENNSKIKNVENLKNILIDNNDSIKKMISSNNGEYSVTINYNIGNNSSSYKGHYIIRNTAFSPTYYYIKLINDSNKWKIISIDKLPLN